MFEIKPLARGIAVAFGGLACAMIVAVPAQAQQSNQKLDRVEITGSAIKQIEAETALPITIISKKQIQESGAQNVAELIQVLPAMQGFITSSESVNGGGGGNTTASLHSIGSGYTLTLLNGRRIAPYNTGTSVNLESLPLASIERIEVLTDGASALYGADAIAGVVNFITRKDFRGVAVDATASLPQASGGKSYDASAAFGYGDLDKDRFNVAMTVSYQKQDSVTASQRAFANSGFRPGFTGADGKPIGLFLSSSNSVPGNVLLLGPSGEFDPKTGKELPTAVAFYSPYYLANGKCPDKHVYRGGVCRYDFASTVDLVPESERATAYTTARFKLNEATQIFGELLLSRFASKPKYAAPAQPGIFLTQAQFDKHVAPNLAALGLTAADVYGVGAADFNGPTLNLRLFDAGGRQDEYKTDTLHAVLGGEGAAFGWDYTGWFNYSENRATDKALSGYMSTNYFNALVSSDKFDPLANTAGQSVAVLAPGVLRDVLDETKSSLSSLNFRASRPIFSLPAGDVAVAVGGDLTRQTFTDDPSAILMGPNKLQPTFTDTILGGGGGALPFDSTRDSWALFTEFAVPILKNMDMGAAIRYDSYDAVSNSRKFDSEGNPVGSGDEGKGASKATYKFTFRFTPVESLLLRASYGTGFKAPSLANITSPLQAFGVTSNEYQCPTGLSASKAAFCKPDIAQYNILQGGNASTGADALKPETSTQWTAGFRFQPMPQFSVGLDYWNVTIKDRIESIPEDVAFADAAKYDSLFVVAKDPNTGQPQTTFVVKPLNLGTAKYSGLDLDVSAQWRTGLGNLTSRLGGTYILESKYEVPGLTGYQTSLGQYGVDNSVTFRWQAAWNTTLQTGKWTNTMGFIFRPGYTDAIATNLGGGSFSGPEMRIYNPVTGTWGARYPSVAGESYVRRVASYTVMNWQTRYQFNQALALVGGIKNVFNVDPPVSIQDGGGGNMRGYDGRYADPIGRQFYVSASYKF